MNNISYSMLISAGNLNAKGNPTLLCVLDFMRRSPSDEGSVIEVHFSDNFAFTDKQIDSFIGFNLPLFKSLLETECIESRRSDRVVFIRAIPCNHDDGCVEIVFH